MAKFNIVVPHWLSQAEALSRVQNEIEALKGQHGDQVSGLLDRWNENTYAFQGSGYGICGLGSCAGDAASSRD
jgi:hypothetical protein